MFIFCGMQYRFFDFRMVKGGLLLQYCLVGVYEFFSDDLEFIFLGLYL